MLGGLSECLPLSFGMPPCLQRAAVQHMTHRQAHTRALPDTAIWQAASSSRQQHCQALLLNQEQPPPQPLTAQTRCPSSAWPLGCASWAHQGCGRSQQGLQGWGGMQRAPQGPAPPGSPTPQQGGTQQAGCRGAPIWAPSSSSWTTQLLRRPCPHPPKPTQPYGHACATHPGTVWAA